MARLDPHVRLLAIALLNHADDEGFFMAAPPLVQAACFPFLEDSVRVHGWLHELVRVGWIEIHAHPTHGPIGRVCGFLDHQAISKPTKSGIRKYWLQESSGSPPGALQDGSRLEGKREEGRGSGEGGVPTPVTRKEGKQVLIRQLRRLGLASSSEAADEWAQLMQGRGGCRTAAEALEGLAWLVEKRPDLRYARQAGTLADAWAQLLRLRNAGPEQALPATISPAEGSEDPLEKKGPPCG